MIRTLFEGGWGEVDHAVVYPYYQDDKILKEYTELLNRLSGLADEMSSFFNRLKQLEIRSIQKKSQIADEIIENKGRRESKESIIQEKNSRYDEAKFNDTPYDCLRAVLEE